VSFTCNNQQEGNQAGDNHQPGDKQVEGMQLEGIRLKDSPAPGQVEDTHKPVHILVGVGTQLAVEWADQYETSAGLGAQPSLMVAQTFHLSYPFQSYAVSALAKHYNVRETNLTGLSVLRGFRMSTVLAYLHACTDPAKSNASRLVKVS